MRFHILPAGRFLEALLRAGVSPTVRALRPRGRGWRCGHCAGAVLARSIEFAALLPDLLEASRVQREPEPDREDAGGRVWLFLGSPAPPRVAGPMRREHAVLRQRQDVVVQ